MAKFGSRSKQKLLSCDARLQVVFNEVIKHYDCSVICGARSKTEQDEAFHSGRSKVQYPNSKHNSNPSVAIDVIPYPVDWADRERFSLFAGFVIGIAASKGIKIRWGGDWDNDGYTKDHNFSDMPHFEIVE